MVSYSAGMGRYSTPGGDAETRLGKKMIPAVSVGKPLHFEKFFFTFSVKPPFNGYSNIFNVQLRIVTDVEQMSNLYGLIKFNLVDGGGCRRWFKE
jgi:hypothetical protein